MASQTPALLSKFKTSSTVIPSDYAIQVTGNPELELAQSTRQHQSQKQRQLWKLSENEYRQVPPYRPINKFLDKKSRPWGSNRVESVFVFTMFQGVWIKSVSCLCLVFCDGGDLIFLQTVAWLWRVMSRTFNISERVFEHRVGGEI